jgi:hypothetical protein
MKENNILLAEFIGYTQPHPNYLNTSYWYKEGEPPLTILLFDKDWNWLMKVIKKILNISLERDNMEQYYEITDSIPSLSTTYEECINFVKLYNQNKDGKNLD